MQAKFNGPNSMMPMQSTNRTQSVGSVNGKIDSD